MLDASVFDCKVAEESRGSSKRVFIACQIELGADHLCLGLGWINLLLTPWN